jgi:hypothetical protein
MRRRLVREVSVSAPATANGVVRNLSELTRELRDKTSAYRTAEHDAAMKRHAANMVEGRAFLAADGAMKLRKHTARVAADRAEGDALVAEALVRILKAEIRSIETRIDVGRTYGATVRAELKTLDYGGAS